MGTPRFVEVLLSVFDLDVTEGFDRKELGSTRVLFTFDRKMGAREFTLLNPGIPTDIRGRIQEWLEQNLDEEKIAYGIKSNRIDVHLY